MRELLDVRALRTSCCEGFLTEPCPAADVHVYCGGNTVSQENKFFDFSNNVR